MCSTREKFYKPTLFLYFYPPLVQWLERSAVVNNAAGQGIFAVNETQSAVTERSPVQIREGGLLVRKAIVFLTYFF